MHATGMTKMSCILRCVTNMSCILRCITKLSHGFSPVRILLGSKCVTFSSCICTCISATRLSLQCTQHPKTGTIKACFLQSRVVCYKQICDISFISIEDFDRGDQFFDRSDLLVVSVRLRLASRHWIDTLQFTRRRPAHRAGCTAPAVAAHLPTCPAAR